MSHLTRLEKLAFLSLFLALGLALYALAVAQREARVPDDHPCRVVEGGCW